MFDELHEECGVFAICNSQDASINTALGLHALQHRGQEAAGIVAMKGESSCEVTGSTIEDAMKNIGETLGVIAK